MRERSVGKVRKKGREKGREILGTGFRRCEEEGRKE